MIFSESVSFYVRVTYRVLGCRGSKVRFPAGGGKFSLHRRVQNGSGTHPASYPMVGREDDYSPPSSAEVKECVELYIYSLNTPSWHDAEYKKSTGTTLHLPFTLSCGYLEQIFLSG
jgi:hypothetical protein